MSGATKLAVLGATGGTGRLVVAEAQRRGFEVAVLARSAEKAADLMPAEVVIGDARDPAALSRLVDGRDAVVSALGTPMSPLREVTLLSTATAALIGAMEAKGVRRLVCITGLGAGDSRGHGGFVFDRVVMPLLLRKVYADKDRQEALIRASALDWTIVRPSVLNDKPAAGRIKALIDLHNVHGGTVARADVARFVVDQIGSEEWLHRSPLITS